MSVVPDENARLINQYEERRRDHKVLALIVAVVALVLVCIGLSAYSIVLSKNIKNSLNPATNPVDNPYGWLKDVVQPQMDMSQDPCDDFYQYSCGGFVANTVLPPGVNMYIPTFQTVELNNYEVLNGIVNGQWPLISDLYQSCMQDPDYVADDTAETLQFVIDQNTMVNETTASTVLPTVAALQAMGVDAFFAISQMDNIFAEGSDNYLQFMQSGISSIDYTDANMVGNYTALIAQVLNVFMNITNARASAVVNLEYTLFNISGNPETYEEAYVNMTFSEFQNVTGYDFSSYISALQVNVSGSDIVIVTTPSFFAELGSAINAAGAQGVSDYLAWRTIYSLALASSFPVNFPPSLVDLASELKSLEFVNPRKAARSIVNKEYLREFTATQYSAAQLACIDSVDTLLSDFVGLLFDLQVVGSDEVDAIHTVTGGVQNSFLNSFAALTWLDDAAREAAAYKLQNIIQIIGHPNLLNRYRGVNLTPDHFLNNILRINQADFADMLTYVGTPFNRSDYEFPATIVNAFYSPLTNTINFPAGILESPMFSTTFPTMLQYARMGYVIGHETTHGFDNNGRLWNAQGVYQGIFDNATSLRFEQGAQCLVDQYNSYEVIPGLYVNGENTLGENIADMGGAKNAYRAYQAWIKANGTDADAGSAKSRIMPSLTNDQLFFVMLGQTWCTKATDAGLASQVVNDVHSPSKFRVNGPLSNFDEFSTAFSCKAGSNMNRGNNACVLW